MDNQFLEFCKRHAAIKTSKSVVNVSDHTVDSVLYNLTNMASDPRKCKPETKFKTKDKVFYFPHYENKADDDYWYVKEVLGINHHGQQLYDIYSGDSISGRTMRAMEDELTAASSDPRDYELPTVPKSEVKAACSHDNAYKNIISKSLQFWYCPDCKQEIKDPNLTSSSKEFEELIKEWEDFTA
jgi:hypothetical protein